MRLGAGFPLAPELSGSASRRRSAWGGYSAEEDGTKTDLGNITTLSFLANLDGPIVQRLHWRAGIGMIGTLPSDDAGIFLQGGKWNALFSAGLDYYLPLFTKFDLMIGARADTHTLTPNQVTGWASATRSGCPRCRSASASRSGRHRSHDSPPAALGLARPRHVLRRFQRRRSGPMPTSGACSIRPAATAVDTLAFAWPTPRCQLRIWAQDTLDLPTHAPTRISTWEAQFLYGEFRGRDGDRLERRGHHHRGGPGAGQVRLLESMARECDGATDVPLDPTTMVLTPPFHVFIDPASRRARPAWRAASTSRPRTNSDTRSAYSSIRPIPAT